jgi:hypothetical protein
MSEGDLLVRREPGITLVEKAAEPGIQFQNTAPAKPA